MASPASSPTAPERLFDLACEHARATAVLGSVEALLGWDEQTMMPSRAAPWRGRQAEAVAPLAHRPPVDPA